MPTLEIEKQLGGIVCGIDEAGRGPWCGPVVAAAVILSGEVPQGINDSKKLSEKKREELFALITQNCIYGIGQASTDEIDQMNILNATKLAMLRAFEALPQKPEYALIDGNQLPKLPCKMQYVIKGDSVSLSIAAASIIAKVTRDRIVHDLDSQFPQYGWAKSKGYGTAAHMQAIEIYGVNIHHRKSFAPIKRLLGV